MNTRTTLWPDVLRKLTEMKERQVWVHHVADATTGELHTTQLPQPVTPLSRAERLSQLGRQIYPPIFGAPTHRLTPRQPYQASPAGFLTYQWARVISSYTDETYGEAVWLSEDIVPPYTGRLDGLLLQAPQGRCLLTLLLGTSNQIGQVGHFRIEVRGRPAENAPLIASFDLTTQGDNYIEHTFDLVYVSQTAPPTCWPAMILEPGSGPDYVRFRSLTLGPASPVLQQ